MIYYHVVHLLRLVISPYLFLLCWIEQSFYRFIINFDWGSIFSFVKKKGMLLLKDLQMKAALPFELFENLNFRSFPNTSGSTSQVEV